MFCTKCGQEIAETDKFCTRCGAPVGEGNNEGQNSDNAGYAGNGYQTNGYGNAGNGGQNNGGDGSKFDVKKYLTDANIERFAPAAALLPLVMAIVVGILGGVLGVLFGFTSVTRFVLKVVMFLLNAIFVLAALAAAVGSCYVATKKDTSKVWTWVVPLADICAFISCLSIAFSWGVPAWIFGIISFIFGIEIVARITLSGNPMDSEVNPSGAFDTYKQYYKNYKEKYPSTNSEKTAVGEPLQDESYFDGKGVELFGYYILGVILCGVTCGIATPWVICMIYKWRIGHTVINGKRLTFDGTGGSLLGHWIIWELLTVITCGIYGFFTYVAVRKWELKHTFIDGEPVVPGVETSYFDGNSFEYLGYSILSGLLICITCGIATPWMMCMIQGWDTKHQVVNGRRLTFDGTGLAFLGEYIIIALLTCITCGIYSPWGTVRMNKYIVKHTFFA